MINRIILYFPILFIIVMMCSCAKKTKLSETELKWMDVYNEGDTLIFKSDKDEFDTTFIIKKEIYYPSYNPVEVHDNYLPQQGKIWYKNKNLKYHHEGYELISLIKKHPRNETFLNIDYLYADILLPNLTTSGIEKYKQGKIYEFDTYREKAQPQQPKKIFWHEDYGIVKYITHANKVWERINLPK